MNEKKKESFWKKHKTKLIVSIIFIPLIIASVFIMMAYNQFDSEMIKRLDVSGDFLSSIIENAEFTVNIPYDDSTQKPIPSDKQAGYNYQSATSGINLSIAMGYSVGSIGETNEYWHNGTLKSAGSIEFSTYPNYLENFSLVQSNLSDYSTDWGYTFRIYQIGSIYEGLSVTSVNFRAKMNITSNINISTITNDNITYEDGTFIDLSTLKIDPSEKITPYGEEVPDQVWTPTKIYNTSSTAYYEITNAGFGGDFFWEDIFYFDPVITSTPPPSYNHTNITISQSYAHMSSNDLRLKLYWNMDLLSNPVSVFSNSVPDLSGNLRHGTMASANVDVIAGFEGNATRFNTTTNEYIYTRSETLQQYKISNAYTIMAWINPIGDSGQGSPSSGRIGGKIISRSHGATNLEDNFGIIHVGLRANATLNDFVVKNEIGCIIMNASNQIRTLTSSTLVSPNTGWHHVACTYNGTEGRVYIDGVMNGSTLNFAVAGSRPTGLINSVSTFLTVGRHLTTLNESFNGSIDEVKIYNYSMSDTEINNTYKNQTSIFMAEGYIPYKGVFHSTGSFNYANVTFVNGTVFEGLNSNLSVRMLGWNPDALYKFNHPNLVFYVPLDNRSAIGENQTKVVDLLGRTNGTIIGGGTFENGLYRRAYKTTSSTNYVNFNDVSFDEGLSGFTVVFWVNKTSSNDGGTNRRVIVHGDSITSDPFLIQYGFDISNNAYGCNYRSTLTQSTTEPDTSVGEWKMKACVFEQNSPVKWYSNGVLVASSPSPSLGTLTTTSDALTIGDITGSPTIMILDNILMFNRTLTAGEIWSLYATGNIDGVNNSAGLNLSITNRTWFANVGLGKNANQIPADVDANFTAPLIFFQSNNNRSYSPIIRNASVQTTLFNIAGFGESNIPIVNLLHPSNGTLTFSQTLYFAANFTDDSTLINSSFKIWNSTNSIVNITNTSITGPNNSTNLSFTFPYPGIFRWNYEAIDQFNNIGRNNTNFTVTYSSCGYTGSGNWTIFCSEYCAINTNYAIVGNISTRGNGEINLSSNFTFTNANSFIFTNPICQWNIAPGNGFGQ